MKVNCVCVQAWSEITLSVKRRKLTFPSTETNKNCSSLCWIIISKHSPGRKQAQCVNSWTVWPKLFSNQRENATVHRCHYLVNHRIRSYKCGGFRCFVCFLWTWPTLTNSTDVVYAVSFAWCVQHRGSLCETWTFWCCIWTAEREHHSHCLTGPCQTLAKCLWLEWQS